MIELSVVILTRDRPERCADSIRHNIGALSGLNAEVIVVNNGTAPVSLPSAACGVECSIIQMNRNAGAAARNEGIKAARGDCVLVLDDDAYLPPGLAKTAVETFRNDPRTGALAFRIRNGDAEEGCLLPTVFHGCACAFRKDAVLAAGGYPLDYLYYGEEYDLAFRLYESGHRIAVSSEHSKVRHARDPGGRSNERIISLLIRNNFLCIASHFPGNFKIPALRDVLQRYKLVARKEAVPGGYRRGLASIPAALFRGFARHRPMNRSLFGKVTLIESIEQIGRALRRLGTTQVAVCGTGKFPSLTIMALRAAGITVRAFLDTNPCWAGQSIRGVPVLTVGTESVDVARDTICLTGTSSLHENDWWRSFLHHHGAKPDPFTGQAAVCSATGTFDLLDLCKISVFQPYSHN